MHLDPVMPLFVGVVLALIVVSLAARAVRQPQVTGYIIAGFLIGPSGLALVDDAEALSRLGAIGVVLLLFFIGMEISPRRLAANWRIAVVGTALQVLISTAVVVLLGYALHWPIARSILLGFVISLSSTAVVLKLLEDWKELDSSVGQDVLGVLLAQDLAVIPMLIGIGFLGGEAFDEKRIALQTVGAALLIGLVVRVTWKRHFRLPLGRWTRSDQELQVLAALLICFGLALMSGVLGLSTALGAFVAGMIVRAAQETDWVEERLHSFRVIFVALFFTSIGMLIDVAFLQAHWREVLVLVVLVVLLNTYINAGILHGLGRSWPASLYAGALLSQIGEFSFVLVTVASQAGIIGGVGYDMAIAVIGISLVVSPAWIVAMKWLLRRRYGGTTALFTD